MFYYSPSTNAFFDPAIHQVMPDDATRRVTRARHAALMAAQAEGATIEPDARGRPMAKSPKSATPAPLTHADLAAAVRAEAQRRILVISPLWRQLNDIREPSEAGAGRFLQIDAIRAVSRVIRRDITETAPSALQDFPVTEHPLWPAIASQES